MTAGEATRATRRRELLRWAAGLGAVTGEALALREREARPDSARARLAAAERAGLMRSWRLLSGESPLYTVTSGGLRAAGRAELPACRVSPASAAHAAACCSAAVALEEGFPGHDVIGEPVISSAFTNLCPRVTGRAGPRAHRPDLVVLAPCEVELPIAVEVELTVKAPERLAAICRAWARQRSVAGVLYFASAPVVTPLRRAIERAHAEDRIVILAL